MIQLVQLCRKQNRITPPTASAGAKDDAQAQAGGDTQAQAGGDGAPTRWCTTSRRNS